jgi:hypothetical protein
MAIKHGRRTNKYASKPSLAKEKKRNNTMWMQLIDGIDGSSTTCTIMVQLVERAIRSLSGISLIDLVDLIISSSTSFSS